MVAQFKQEATMSLTQEDLNAIGDLLDSKLEPIEDAIVRVNKRLAIIKKESYCSIININF